MKCSNAGAPSYTRDHLCPLCAKKNANRMQSGRFRRPQEEKAPHSGARGAQYLLVGHLLKASWQRSRRRLAPSRSQTRRDPTKASNARTTSSAQASHSKGRRRWMAATPVRPPRPEAAATTRSWTPATPVFFRHTAEEGGGGPREIAPLSADDGRRY